jgi:NADH-quinone oxidoreductase subunit L
MGGVAKNMKVTTVVFTIGALALAGIPPLSGFFSKDLILDSLLAGHYYVYFAIALATAMLTAFYMMRLWLRVFAGQPADEKHAAGRHESDWKMLSPMIVLAAITIVVGIGMVSVGKFVGGEAAWPQLVMGSGSVFVALLGIGLAWLLFGGGRDAEAWKARSSLTYLLLSNKYFMDRPYEWIAGSYTKLSENTNWFDRVVINGVVNGVGVACKQSGALLKKVQNGQVQTYQRLVLAGVLVFILLAVVLRGV